MLAIRFFKIGRLAFFSGLSLGPLRFDENLNANSAYCGEHFKVDSYAALYLIANVKILSAGSQSAGVCGCSYRTRAAPQRLNAEHLAWFVGLIEADGWFSIKKCGKYLQYEMGLEIHKRDLPMLHQINRMFKFQGKIYARKDRVDSVVLRVRKKRVLISKVIPLFQQYPMLTEKHKEFLFFRYHLTTVNSIYRENFEKMSLNWKSLSVNQMLQLPYFDSWLIGFINGEGCFSTFLRKGQKNLSCSFRIGQKLTDPKVIEAIRERIGVKNKLWNNSDKHFWALNIESVEAVQKVMDLIHKTTPCLRGYKRIQFILWIKQMRLNPRYQKVKIPTKI